jgi:hypothetical protein
MPKIIDTRDSRKSCPDAQLNISTGKNGIELSIQNIHHPFMVDILTVPISLLPTKLKSNQFFLIDDAGDIIPMLIQQGWIEQKLIDDNSFQDIPVYGLSKQGLEAMFAEESLLASRDLEVRDATELGDVKCN